MFWSIVLNAALAFGMVIIFIYSVGDVEEIANPSYPLINICLDATGSVPAASAMLGTFLCTVIAGAIGSVTSISRLTWAWARHGTLPAYFAHVDQKHCIPLRSTWSNKTSLESSIDR
jgi:choline transport protein